MTAAPRPRALADWNHLIVVVGARGAGKSTWAVGRALELGRAPAYLLAHDPRGAIPRQTFFSLDSRIHFASAINIYARTQGDPRDVMPRLRAQVGRVDSNLLITGMRTMDDALNLRLANERFLAPVLDRILRVAWERAGKLPPPQHPEGSPPRERALRLLLSVGDEWERALAEQVGLGRAHAVRMATTWRRGERITGPPACAR